LRSFNWTPLPYTRREVERIAAAYPEARLYLGEEATEERAKSTTRDARVLHFATHGYLDDRTPLDSALVLTIPEELSAGRDNGLLQVWEIFESVRLDADLVVLSACDSALGRELSGEGLIGLTRAFQYAGARSVVASLWSVADRVTAELMARFHRSLANAERQLAIARGKTQGLETEKADPPRREDGGGRSDGHADQVVVASHEVEVSVAPRFALRGEENPESGFLREGGAVNTVRIARPADRFTMALSLADHPVYGEYRLELLDRSGEVLWAGRRPGKALLGDIGTSVAVSGLDPGLYRLRVEGLKANRGELLAEYRLAVERQEAPQ
jgi:hypothetical protein